MIAKDLAILGADIQKLFDSSFQSNFGTDLKGYSIAAWEYESERFDLWAKNIGLPRPSNKPLDYRLRESSALQSIALGLLTDLKISLDERESRHLFIFIGLYFFLSLSFTIMQFVFDFDCKICWHRGWISSKYIWCIIWYSLMD